MSIKKLKITRLKLAGIDFFNKKENFFGHKYGSEKNPRYAGHANMHAKKLKGEIKEQRMEYSCLWDPRI